MPRTVYLVELLTDANACCWVLLHLGRDIRMTFSRKAHAIACRDHLREQMVILYGEQVGNQIVISLFELQVSPKEQYLVFNADKIRPAAKTMGYMD